MSARNCYIVGADKFVYGPFATEEKAARTAYDRDTIRWLADDDIDAYGYLEGNL